MKPPTIFQNARYANNCYTIIVIPIPKKITQNLLVTQCSSLEQK